mmetsp:Transcript_26103/g.57185  ORF Transcript_26103/g.57185 Transcript_26103/m.57185 type:complete len:276 (+) Transcript_26103:50-877(+)
MHIPILASGRSWLVVAKPSGIVVHRNEWSYDHQIALLQLVRDQIGMQVNPVHRLDAGTSGCLIFATDSPTSAMIQEAMQKEDARKTYYAFCRGDASWIGNRTESRPIKDDKGIVRDATTLLECVGACDDDSVPPEIGLRSSLLVARPVTGRWHQIRRHMNGLAHPVLNDAKHGDSRVNRWWRARYNLSGLGLHCAEVKLSLPNGELLHAECPVRRDLTKIWSQLPWWEQAQQHLPLVSASDPWDVDSVAELAAMIAEADEAAKSKRKRRVRTETA